jgi:hypothetical protein
VSSDLSLRDWLREQEKQYLARQLKLFSGRIGPTARHSGVDVKTLYRKMREYGLDKKTFQIKAPLKTPSVMYIPDRENGSEISSTSS